MKTPFLDYWSRRKERGEVLENRHKLKLTAAQLSSLSGDNDVRAALQKTRVDSLLPPVGTEVFRRFSPASLERIQKLMDSKNKLPAPELESEKVLPFFYGAPPSELQNVPLEDPDPFYQSQKTFVVVSKGRVLTRFNADASCYHFSPFSLFRRLTLFTLLLLVTLLVNCFFMQPAGWGFILESVFLSIYTVEAALKILSRGFCLGRFTYLRDSWNRLDLFIIITGLVFFNVPDLWFLKSLRYLKILGLFFATRRHAKTFGQTLIRLWDVLFLTLLVLSVFSLLGLNLFMGTLSNKCVLSWEQSNSTLPLNSSDSQNFSEEFDFEEHLNNETSVQTVTFAFEQGHSDFSLTNYDSFEFAFLATFRLMLRDFWEDLAAKTMQADGLSSMIYFVVTLLICSFSLLAFIIAAFVITFTEQTEREVQEAKQDQKDYNKILAALKEEIPEKKDPEQRTCAACCRRFCSCNCCGCWVQLKTKLQFVVLDPFFDLAIIILIILNVLFMAMEHFPLTSEFAEMLTVAGAVFSLIFFLEVVLKIFALGCYDFFKVRWHIFDTFLVVFSIVDFVLGMYLDFGLGLRLFRLGRWWPGLLRWIRLVWAGVRSPWALSVVLTVLFFTVFGNLSLAPVFEPYSSALGRWHFGDFIHSFMTVMRALYGEWIETMWICMNTTSRFGCGIFYVTLLIVGNFLIFSLFLTLLLKWINDKLAPKDEEKMQTLRNRFAKVFKVCGLNKGKAKNEKTGAAEDKESMALSSATPEQTEENGTHSSTLPIGEAQNFQKMKEAEEHRDSPENCFCQKCYSCCPALDLNKSQGCGRVWFNLRQSSFNIIQHPYFNNFIFFIVLVSSVALVCEDKFLPTHTDLKVFLGYLDQVITYLFVLEILFKWIGLGFKRYFTDGWCWLDLIVTLACVLSVAAQSAALGSALISLKALRPLRILSHVKGTRLSVCVLVRMLPSLLDVILVTATVWLFFTILFVQIFAGKFFYCFNETSNEQMDPEEVANKSECLTLIFINATDVRWKNALFNFDNQPAAYLSLFTVATSKGWIDVLYSALDSSRLINFVLFLYVGGSHLFLTENEQKDFNNISFCPKRPLAPCPRPQGRLRARLYDLVSREAFEWVMQVFIFVGFVLLMVETNHMSEKKEMVLSWLRLVLILIFAIECILKICAFRRSYFSDSLNVIDFVVVILSLFVSPRHLQSRPAAFYLRFHLRQLRHLPLLHLKKIGPVSDIFNFDTFWNGLVFMLTVTTWAPWDLLLIPSLYTPPDCDPIDVEDEGIKANCGNPQLGLAFTLSFLALSSYVVLQMLLVLLLDLLNVFGRMRCDPLSSLNTRSFFKTWKKFVPDSAHYIQHSSEDLLHCRDVLLALSVRALGDSADKEALVPESTRRVRNLCPTVLLRNLVKPAARCQ
ncbi:hypothetical protein WMY93_022276 [Mugilogobius chulae]|uniref:Uncharacterized protein n=1 Tax=Mugilogobius chulae TaxID=88201 RepID=A0AAW0NCB7_9GOBI